jgi:glyoxylase-like metal-dependent hydrolase (beta-lactamase superfamily II)
LRELGPGIHSIGGTKGGHVRAFVIDAGGELTLVDTLFDSDAHDVLGAIERMGRSPRDLKHIVLTHAHRSHLGGLAALKRLTGATVCSHEREADIVSGDRRAQPVTLRPVRPLRTWPFQLGLALGRPKHVPCPVDRLLDEGDAVGPLEVLHAPGHSPGHLAFYWPDRGLLIAGDAIATWPRFDAGWPAFNLNLEEHHRSVRRMAALEAAIVGVGHGEPITEDAAARIHGLVDGSGDAPRPTAPARSG